MDFNAYNKKIQKMRLWILASVKVKTKWQIPIKQMLEIWE